MKGSQFLSGAMRACGAVVLLLVGSEFSGCYVETSPPDALIMVDDVQKVYISPPCLRDAAGAGDLEYIASFSGPLRTATGREIEGQGYRPEPGCRDAGGFTASYGLLRPALAFIGLIESPSRWRDDGSWKW